MKNKIIISFLCVFLCLVLLAASFDIRDNSDLGFEDTLNTISSLFSPVTSAFNAVTGIADSLISKPLVEKEGAEYSEELLSLVESLNKAAPLYFEKKHGGLDCISDQGYFNFNVFETNAHIEHKVCCIATNVGLHDYKAFYCGVCQKVVCIVGGSVFGGDFNKLLYPASDVVLSFGFILVTFKMPQWNIENNYWD